MRIWGIHNADNRVLEELVRVVVVFQYIGHQQEIGGAYGAQ